MPSKTYNVKSYTYTLNANSVNTAQLFLQADNGGTIAYIRFVDETSPLPAPSVNSNLTYGTAAFRRSALHDLIDMLRNERPVTLLLGDEPTFYFYTGTSEPVGEAES